MPTTDENTIQKLRRQLLEEVPKLFQEEPTPCVTGTAIGFLPADWSARSANAGEQAVDPVKTPVSDSSTAETPKILIFMDPSAPECERAAIKKQVQNMPSVEVMSVSRFIGLQASAIASPGDSIGTFAPFRFNLPPVNAGTLGARVVAQGREYILSSNHVLAHNGRATADTPIAVPGAIDDVTAGPVIAKLSHFVSLKPPVSLKQAVPVQPGVPVKSAPWPFQWLTEDSFNSVDCALAEVSPAGTINPSHQVDVSSIGPSDMAALSQVTVTKKGRATDTTGSRIRLFDLRIPISFTFGTYYFQGLIGTLDDAAVSNPPSSAPIFAAPGDSGSVAGVDRSASSRFGGRAVGLVTARAYVFDASDQFFAYIIAMCPMDSVATELAAQIPNPSGTKLTGNDLTFFIWP